MLRHKRIVNLSLNSFRKNLKFYDCKHFHTTNCFFLRRIASRKEYSETRSSPEENVVAGNFESQPLTKTFNNFYGIESDEGVVHIKAQPNVSQDSFIHKFTSKQMSEKFKNTCFGKVRLDSENKVIIHGQYEEDTSLSDDSEIDNVARFRQFAIDSSGANTSPSNEKELLPRFKSPYAIKSKFNASIQMDSVKNSTDSQLETFEVSKEHNHKVENDVSLIDESYFPEKLLKDDQKIVDSSSISKESDNIHNFNSKKLNNENGGKFSFANDNLDVGNVKLSDSSLHENHVLSEEKSIFFDELVFGSKLEGKNVDAKEKSVFKKTPELGTNQELSQIPSFSDNEKTSFFDEYYFNGRLENKLIEKDSECAVENASLSKSRSNDNVAEEARIYETEKEEKIYQSKTKLRVENAEINKNKFSSYGTKFLKQMSNEKSHKINPTSNNDSPMLMHSDNSDRFSYHEAAKDKLNPMPTLRSMSPSSFTEDLPHDKNAIVLEKSRTNHTKKLENNEILSRNEQKQCQDEQPETAFDFVKKLRGEKVLTYHEKISGISKTPREKLDSKGFRILKYQVPELKYFTRDEMLELLVKNVLYSDDDVIVLNKPYNLVMHDSQTTKDACLSKYLDDLAGELDKNNKKPKLLTVHRLDKETTGCLLLARNEASAQYLKSLFAQRKIVKTYWIVTIKVPNPLQGIIDIPITEGFIDNKRRMVLNPDLPKDLPYRNHSKRGKNAVTRYNVISQSGNAALVEVKPETGIKHQIRVHFGLGLACPILGDHKYSYPDKLVPQKLQADLLHKLFVRQSKVRHIPMHIYARSIFIPQYNEGRNLFVMAPMPIHMSKNLQRLKFKKK